ncbi:MAG: amidohydrolase [Firmicutes bacterium]|nr:amidohydrolase [Bacillota bacterium]
MIRKEIEQLSENCKHIFEEVSDCIWATPETNYTEEKSTEAQRKVMEELGFKIIPVPDMPTAFVAEAGSGKPVIAILGEHDALPNLSAEADIPEWKEIVHDGPGHGCGHNLLGAGAMESAYILWQYMQAHNLQGTVKFCACPAEEGGVGKVYMIHRGVFDDVDFTISWHPGAKFGITHKCKSIAISNFKWHGKSAHAAGNPQHGRSALDAMELTNVGIQFLREHVDKETYIHYSILNGGGPAPNVVQSSAMGQYVVRCKDNTELVDTFRRVVLCAKGAATMTETTLEEPTILSAFSSMIDNEVMADILRKNIEAIKPVSYTDEEIAYAKQFQAIGSNPDAEDAICQELDETGAGSTDVADVSWVTPLIYLRVPTLANGTIGHHWTVTAQGKGPVAKKGLHIAARLMADTCIDMLEDPSLIEAAKEEFKKQLKGKKYEEECLIPKTQMPCAIY